MTKNKYEFSKFNFLNATTRMTNRLQYRSDKSHNYSKSKIKN